MDPSELATATERGLKFSFLGNVWTILKKRALVKFRAGLPVLTDDLPKGGQEDLRRKVDLR